MPDKHPRRADSARKLGAPFIRCACCRTSFRVPKDAVVRSPGTVRLYRDPACEDGVWAVLHNAPGGRYRVGRALSLCCSHRCAWWCQQRFRSYDYAYKERAPFDPYLVVEPLPIPETVIYRGTL